MSCPHCTLVTYEDGTESDWCKGFYYTSDDPPLHDVTVRIEPWVDDDDGSMWWTILMSDQWLSDHMHELGEKSKLAGFIVTSMPAPPFCPWCGERIGGQ